MVGVSIIHCRYCEQDHGDLLLCPPAKRVLDALYAQGQQFNMPTVEFPEPITGAFALGGDAILIRQFVVKGAVMDVGGTPRGVLIFTGQDLDGRPLPEWVYPGSDRELNAAAKLVTDMTEMAIRRARQARTP